MIRSLTSTERYAFDYKRPMQAVALEPGFAKKASRTFVCGGMAGNLIMQEKGWLGYKEQIIHSGEGPIWAIEWRGELIAWANDLVRNTNHIIKRERDTDLRSRESKSTIQLHNNG